MYTFFGTWPWYVSGFLMGAIMLTLVYFGKTFGMSSNLRTLCSAMGAGKVAPFFNFDWKAQRWNLAVVVGCILGGFFASTYLSDQSGMQLNPKTLQELEAMHIETPTRGEMGPDAMFTAAAFQDPKMIAILLMGGLLVGFGTRYAGGCTSGHAITGLSSLQLPSLIAVIGFFIGGLIVSNFILPLIFN
ncbi:MAG: YeeE/YedE family protein [Flavobacterium sp.]|nr:YeeE/YedE family protein [Candidatus Neoflavobacterium equi]